MSSNLVVVAIPDENDRVWKVSSEKVPHLTLLYLGDADKVANLEQIMQYVEHAASTTLNRFYLSVAKRDELGDAGADVLFFRKNGYDLRAVRDFRSALLKDPNVKTAYDSSPQFEAPPGVGLPGQPWIPHLTLGYPESPAKPIPDSEIPTFYDVCFNKVAVWTGDFDGPEFELKDYWDEMDLMEVAPMDVAMSDIQHFGTKGMRWGQRKDTTVTVGGQTKMVTPRKAAKLDKKWQKRIYTVPGAVDVHNASADHFNSKIEAVNAKHPHDFSKETFGNPANWSENYRSYMKDINDLQQESVRQAVEKVHGTSPTGMKKAELHVQPDGEFASIKVVDANPKVKHAADDEEVVITFRMKDGLIVEANQAEVGDAMAQTIDLGAEFMAHYGVKGMRWGVNRDDISRAAESTTSTLGKSYRDVDKFARDIEFESNTRERINPDTRIQETSKAKQAVEEKGSSNFVEKDLPVIKNKPEYQKARKLRNRLLHPRDSATKAYRKEVKEAYIKRLEEAANSMKNASGTREYTIREEGGQLPGKTWSWNVSTREVKHDAVEDHMFTVEVIMDEDGFVTDLKKTEDALAQSMDFGSVLISDLMEDAGFEHYGVKGMRWGVRREGFVTRQHQRKLAREGKRQEHRAPSDVRATPTIGRSRRKKSEIKTKGGEDHPPAVDAVKVAAARQKLRKSGVAALSNNELQEMQRRLNLEADVQRLLVGNRSAGQKFVDGILGRGNKEDRKGFENQLGAKTREKAGPVVSEAAKRAAKKAAAAAAAA